MKFQINEERVPHSTDTRTRHPPFVETPEHLALTRFARAVTSRTGAPRP
jgi:hypothetical protein